MTTTGHFQDCEGSLEPETLPTCGAARCVEGEHGLNGDIHGRDVEGFEHDLQGQQGGKDCLTDITASPGPQDAL